MFRSTLLYYNIFIFICYSLSGQKSYHIDLLAHFSTVERSSSIWGYTDSNGIEYALLGTELGLRVFSLENPYNPLEIKFIEASPSIWREIKTSGQFAYVTTEAKDGLLILDLSAPKDSIPFRFVKEFADSNSVLHTVSSAHTIFVDEDGLIYLAGASPIGGGFVLLDPRKNPWEPRFIMEYSGDYFHEVFATRNRLYAAELFNGLFGIYDISLKDNPIRLNDQPTAKTFTHAVWMEKNRPILYTTDEQEAAYVESWDLSDEQNIKIMGRFRRPKNLEGYPIPHNVFHHDQQLYVSYYTEGLRILDTRYPDNMIEVAWYDTHDEYENGFHGCWNVYPFFNSGICIASDIENGLFVLKYDGHQAGFIEAVIRDAQDSSAIHEARVLVSRDSHSIETFSNIKGLVKSGYPEEDSVWIRIEKKGYFPLEFKSFITRNEILKLNLYLRELPQHQFRIHVIDQLNRQNITNAQVVLSNNDFRFTFQTDSTGYGQLDQVYQNKYNLVAGKWSYRQEQFEDIELNKDLEFEVELLHGYEDDFELNLGWTSEGTDPNVKWIQGDFSELSFPYSNFPIADLKNDIGTHALYTSNYEASDSAFSLKAELNLYSPWMDLSAFESVDIEYSAWAYGGYKSIKEIYLCTKDTNILLENITENLSGSFNPKTILSIDLMGNKFDSAQLRVRLYNDPDSFYQAIRLLAAFDGFKLSGKVKINTEEPQNHSIQIYPNPSFGSLFISNAAATPKQDTLCIYNSLGQKCKTLMFEGSMLQIDLSGWPPGFYYITADGQSRSYGFILL